MSSVIPFDFKNHAVRVIQDDNGEPWFVLKDICDALGLKNASVVAQRLDSDELRKFNLGSQIGEVHIINESGLYSVILRSDKKEAKTFKKWLTSEVLPSIRKTGSYQLKPLSALELARQQVVLLEQLDGLQNMVKTLEPQAAALQRISGGEGNLCISDTAKALGVQPKALFEWLSQNRWIFRRHGAKHWLGYQPRVQSGLIKHKVLTVVRKDFSEKVVEQVLITPKGLTKLASVMVL